MSDTERNRTHAAVPRSSARAPRETAPVSRRTLLKGGAAVGAAAAMGGTANMVDAGAGQIAPPGASPWRNRRFRGLVQAEGGVAVADLELIWPIGPTQVLIATEATQASYSNTQVLRTRAAGAARGGGGDIPTPPGLGGRGGPGAGAPPGPPRPSVVGYTGVGRVVFAGEQVRRARVGDRVLVGVTPQCGVCYNCLRGRPDMCQYLEGDAVNGNQNPAFARLVSDGREVTGGKNGFSELMVANDDWVVPLFTDLPAAALSLLGSVGATGLGATTVLVPVEPGSDVVVFGCGPVGLSMVNGAAIAGANRIIAVEPIAYRRQAALDVGATTVVDPTGKDDTLVEELVELTRGRTNRFYAGGRGASRFPFASDGPDFIYEATGSQLWDPAERGIERQPDPTGVLEMRHIFLLCPGYGTIVTSGVRWGVADIPIPGVSLTNAGKRLIQGQYGGAGLMRDVPRMVNMMERGQYKWQRIVSAQYPLEQARRALEDAAYRTMVSAHVVFDPTPFLR